MVTTKPIGKAIKELLENSNYSYQDLANRTKISKPYLAEIISKDKIPSKEKIEKIAVALSIEPFYFREYRLIKLKEYIELYPDILEYDNEEDLVESINYSLNKKFMEKEKKIDDPLRELREALTEQQKSNFNFFKDEFSRKLLSKMLTDIINGIFPNKIDKKDIDIVISVLERLIEKQK